MMAGFEIPLKKRRCDYETLQSGNIGHDSKIRKQVLSGSSRFSDNQRGHSRCRCGTLDDVKRISTNGACICFAPVRLQKLDCTELDFILSHQRMHIALGHIDRPRYYQGDRFHLACDIVANSHLELLGWKYDKLPHIGRMFHETFFPAMEGHSLTAREAFACVPFDPAAMKPG